MLNVLLVGAGAVGCFYGSRLHQPSRGVHVSIVARSNYEAIAKNGITMLTRAFGDYDFHPAHVFPNVETAATYDHDWHYIIIATKALPDRSDESALIADLVGPSTCIVIIQNGVGVEAPFRLRFPQTPIVSAVTVISAHQELAGVIRQNRWTRISLGPFAHGVEASGHLETGNALIDSATSASTDLCRLLGPGYGGLKDAEQHDELDLQVIRWHKLCINAAMNPSSILCGGLGNADMVSCPELREHLLGVMYEIWNAIPLVLKKPRLAGLATPEEIIDSTARNRGAKPSMLLDWQENRPLEIEVLLGNPLRVAKERGVQMPRVQALYALLKSAQRQRDLGQKSAHL